MLCKIWICLHIQHDHPTTHHPCYEVDGGFGWFRFPGRQCRRPCNTRVSNRANPAREETNSSLSPSSQPANWQASQFLGLPRTSQDFLGLPGTSQDSPESQPAAPSSSTKGVIGINYILGITMSLPGCYASRGFLGSPGRSQEVLGGPRKSQEVLGSPRKS